MLDSHVKIYDTLSYFSLFLSYWFIITNALTDLDLATFNLIVV